MRNVSKQNRENNIFPFLFEFQSNNHAIFYNAITCMRNVVQDGECVNPVKLERKIHVLK